MPHMVLVFVMLASVVAWSPAEAAQAMDRYQSDTAVSLKTIPGDITFEVPLNLTRLQPDITKVNVICTIESDAFAARTIKGTATRPQIGGQVELPVSAGQIVTTARVIVPVTMTQFQYQDPAGKTANYHCELSGFSTKATGGGWQPFTDTSTNTSFRISPTPASLTGTFVW